jgi:hypothetical protein
MVVTIYVVRIPKYVFLPDSPMHFFFLGKIPFFILGVRDDQGIKLNCSTICTSETKQLKHVDRSEKRSIF